MENRYLRGSFTATADALAFIEFTKRCTIKLIQIDINADLDADAEGYTIELSRVPYFQGGTNDAQGIIATVSEQCGAAGAPANLVTSGRCVVIPTSIEVENGQRVYLNGLLAGTADVDVRAVLLCS